MPWRTTQGIEANARSATSARLEAHAHAWTWARVTNGLAAGSRLSLILTIGAVLTSGSLLVACAEGGSTTVQGAVIGSERGATGIYSGRDWEMAKRYSY